MWALMLGLDILACNCPARGSGSNQSSLKLEDEGTDVSRLHKQRDSIKLKHRQRDGSANLEHESSGEIGRERQPNRRMGASVRAAQICDLTRVDLIPSRRLACGSRLKTRCAWFRRESRDLRQDQTLTDTGLRWNPCKARCRQSPNSCIAPKTTHTQRVLKPSCATPHVTAANAECMLLSPSPKPAGSTAKRQNTKE